MISFEPLLPHLPAWALVLFRLTGIFLFAPMLGSRILPMRVKALLALALSFCIYPSLLDAGSPSAVLITPLIESGLSFWSMAGAIAMELAVGLAIGYGASLPMIGMQLGGQIIDQQMGIQLAGVLNPEFGEESGIISEFYFLLAVHIFIILGGHRVLFETLAGTFSTIPPGGFHPDGELVQLFLGLINAIFELALRVAAPLLCLIFAETVAMGFIARTVPQMNVLSVGFAIRILIGAFVLIMAVGIHSDVYTDALIPLINLIQDFFTR